jgi:hypothetical protein
MSLILAGSITLDSTFKTVLLPKICFNFAENVFSTAGRAAHNLAGE